MATANADEKKTRADPGRYFRSMAQFVGFGPEEIKAIKATRFVIEKHIPGIVAKFYDHLLRYPPTQKYFLKKDGTIDHAYLKLRMHHLTNFWRRTASGIYDDKYAEFVDYVGLAHTSQGADPKIYIPERYVVGQVGFVQHAISEAISTELHEIDPELEIESLRAWNLLMMVLLEMLSRAYSSEHELSEPTELIVADPGDMLELAEETYEQGLGLYRSIEYLDFRVGAVDEIPDGDRKIIRVDNQSIGVFHHNREWYAVSNYCLHAGGPVATGKLEGDVLECPWHGYKYDLKDGHCVFDPSVILNTYPVELRDGEVYIKVPQMTWGSDETPVDLSPEDPRELASNEFLITDLKEGQILRVSLNQEQVAVFYVGGEVYATQNSCTHEEGDLSSGEIGGKVVVCPVHDACFDVTTGKVLRGPAKKPLRRYRVVVEGPIGRVEKEDA